jgi:hypothetical protein
MNAAALCFPGKFQEALDTSRLLLSKAEIDPDDLKYYRGPEEGFTLWQQHMNPHYYEKSLQERVEIATGFTDRGPVNGPLLIRRAIARDDIPRLAVSMRNGIGETLLHAVGKSIGMDSKRKQKGNLAGTVH